MERCHVAWTTIEVVANILADVRSAQSAKSR